MLVLLCVLAAGLSVALIGSTEVVLSSAQHSGVAADYVAQAFLERAVADLRWIPDWDLVLNGSLRSGLADGAPGGVRVLPMTTASIDLDGVRNLANCGHRGMCSEAELIATSSDRPWGENNPRWRLFAYAPAGSLLPAGRVSIPFYGLVLVADDGGEEDGDAEADGTPGTAGAGVLWLRAIAVGVSGARTGIDAAVERPGTVGAPVIGRPLRLRSWVRRPTVAGPF